MQIVKDKEDMDEALTNWLELQPRKIKDNSLVVKNTDATRLLHISTDSDIKAFTPRLPENRIDSDTNVVPRVCVSPDLAACIVGHGRVHWDVYMNEHEYTVYGFEWNYAVQPNEKIAGIGEHNVGTELWLVPYEKAYVYNKPVKLGKVSIVSVSVVPSGERHTSFFLNMAIKATDDFPFYLDGPPVTLSAGKHYQVKFEPWLCNYPKRNLTSFTIEEIDKSKYDSLVSKTIKSIPDKLGSLKWGKR